MQNPQLRNSEYSLFPQVINPIHLAKRTILTQKTGVQRLVELDRYSLRDNTLETLKVGDTVVAEVKYDPNFPVQGYGTVKSINGNTVTLNVEYPEYLETNNGQPIDLENFTTTKEKVIKPLETYWEQIAYRAAKGVASVEKSRGLRRYWFRQYFNMLKKHDAVPGGRILYGAGSGNNVTLFNCYVTPALEDSRRGIARGRETTMEIMSRGGGVGTNGSTLRPKDAIVKGVNGKSSGALSWLDDLSRLTHLVQQGGCVAPYEKVLTSKGWDTVENIFNNPSQTLVQTHKGLKPITAKFDNGIKPVYKVTTEHGYSVDASEDHKFGVFQPDGTLALVPLKDLKEGDEISILLGNKDNFPTDYIKLDTTATVTARTQFTTSDPTLPSYLTEDLAFLLGYYLANGCNISAQRGINEFKGFSLSVPLDRPNESNKLTSLITELFDLSVTIENTEGAWLNQKVYSTILMRYLEDNNLTKAKSKHVQIPDLILNSPRSVLEAYIGGLFAGDGTNKGTKGGLSYTTISRTLATQYQQALLSLGVASNIHIDERKDHDKWNTLYVISVNGKTFMNKFADILEGYTSKIYDKDFSIKESSFSFPFNLHERFKHIPAIKKSIGSNAKRTSLKAVNNMVEYYSWFNAEDKDLVDLLSNTVASPIKAIDFIEDMNVYDFEVEDVHMLSFNGTYTSNSRRGAQMVGFGDWHPDLIAFILCKIQNPYVLAKIVKESDDTAIKQIAESFLIRDAEGAPTGVRDSDFMTGANISVLISDDFMKAVENDEMWTLRFPDLENLTPEQKHVYDTEWQTMVDVRKWEEKGYPVRDYHTYRAQELWDLINIAARYSAEPGVIFIDTCNNESNSWYYAPLIVTNPCGEQPLPPWAVCNLIAINLANFYNKQTNTVDYPRLRKTVRVSQRFADNVIDHSYYFLEENEKMALGERRVGKGVMGLADLLIDLKIPYGSPESLEVIDELFEFIKVESYLESANIAEEKGSFPYYEEDKFLQSGFMKRMPERVIEAIKEKGVRNVCSLTIAPTGSTGTMVGVSTGLEPYYAFNYFRSGRLGKFIPIHTEIAQRYFDQNPGETELPSYYVAANDLTPSEHAKVQGTIQKHIDSAISKTCNAPSTFTVEDNKDLYMEAYKSGCKGVTVYVDGSRDTQVLNLTAEDSEFKDEDDQTETEFSKTPEAVLVGETTSHTDASEILNKSYQEPTDEELTSDTRTCTIGFDESGNMIKECH